MGKTDGEHVAQITEGNESGKTTRSSTVAKNVAEKETGNNHLTLRKVGFRNCSEVSHIREDVQDGSPPDCQGCRPGQGFLRVPNFAQHIVGILPAFVGVNDAQQSLAVCIGTAATIAITDFQRECVVKVVRLFDLQMTSQSSKTREDDEEQDENLENAEDAEKADTPFWKRGMESDREGDTSDGYTTRRPAIGCFRTSSEQHIATESERVAGRKSKQQHLRSKNACCNVFGVTVDALQIVLFAA